MINAEERKYLVRVASTMPDGDGLRRAILAGLLRLAEEEEEVSGKGPGKDFIEYMKEVWDGGKKKVSNPNPKTRDSHPEVAVSTAMKDKKSTIYKQVMDGFKKWTEEKKGGDDKKSDKPLPDQKKARGVLQKILEQSSISYRDAPYNPNKVRSDIDEAFRDSVKAQGARHPGSKMHIFYNPLVKDYEKAADSLQTLLKKSLKSKDDVSQDTLNMLESAFDHLKDTAKKAVEGAANVKIPRDVIDRWKKETGSLSQND